MPDSNPLQGFFRKPKFQLSLPSKGKWWPSGSIELNENGTVNVISMSASDDLKFKASETSISGTSTYELIKSCIPNIKAPEHTPSIDLDVILLSIRRATYGNELVLTVPVPGTSLTRKITLDISSLLSNYAKDAEWVEDLTIVNEQNEELKVKVVPNAAKSLFAITKSLSKQQQHAMRVAESTDTDEDTKLESLDMTIKGVNEVKLTSVTDCITEITVGDYKITNHTEITDNLKNLDVEFFNAIQDHLMVQRKKYAFQPIECTSTESEIAAGAPPTWNAELNFAHSDFFKNVDNE
jgi:hypothetical protein